MDETDRQIVEQFRIGGRLAGMAKITRRRNERLAEEPTAQAIDHDACSKRVIASGDGCGQFLATASLLEWYWIAFGENLQEAPFYQRSFALDVPAHEDVEVLC